MLVPLIQSSGVNCKRTKVISSNKDNEVTTDGKPNDLPLQMYEEVPSVY